jgi:hypothetical protein
VPVVPDGGVDGKVWVRAYKLDEESEPPEEVPHEPAFPEPEVVEVREEGVPFPPEPEGSNGPRNELEVPWQCVVPCDAASAGVETSAAAAPTSTKATTSERANTDGIIPPDMGSRTTRIY